MRVWPLLVFAASLTAQPEPKKELVVVTGVYEPVAIEESDRPIIRLPLPVTTVNAPTAAVLYQFREVALHGRIARVNTVGQPAWTAR